MDPVTLTLAKNYADQVGGISIDAVGDTAGRSAYDAEDAGFAYFDNEADLLYIRIGAAGNWSGGASITGADGADGSVWHSGSGAPGSGLGVNGDYYLNTDDGEIYEKVAGSWGSIGNIQGADGVDGQGVPAMGTTGQVLAKASDTDYDTEWANVDLTSITESLRWGAI